jgi:NADP-dependent 3-hydroxy acid dehydrogenase YdfG
VIETNFFGQVNGARAVLPIFRGQGYGTLINVASVDARLPQLDASAHTASKHGIRSFGMNLRQELLLYSASVSFHGAWNPAA